MSYLDSVNNPFITAQANVASAYAGNNKAVNFGELSARKPVEYQQVNTAIETTTKPQFGVLEEDQYHQALKAIEINEMLAQAREESERGMYLSKPCDNGELTPAIGGITWA